MATKMEEFSVNNSEEFESMIEHGDIRVVKALVGTILKTLKAGNDISKLCLYF